MKLFLFVLSKAVYYMLTAMQFLILARFILSMIPSDDDNKLFDFVFAVTEPILMPVRNFLDRFEFTQRIPMDFSGIVAILLLFIFQLILSAFQ